MDKGDKKSGKKKRIMSVVTPAISVLIAVGLLLVFVVIPEVIIPNRKYGEAVSLMESGRYEDAANAFRNLDAYKDINEKISECETAQKDLKYESALSLMEAGKYADAAKAFGELNGYKDSDDQIKNCETAVRYEAASDLYNEGKYYEAIAAFKALNGYKDSAEQITRCETAVKDEKYNSAVELYNAGKYDEAITAFKALNGYKDSAEQITRCETAVIDVRYAAAVGLLEKGDYINAYVSFMALGGYRDSAEKAREISGKYEVAKIKKAAVGDIVYYGAYEQDNNLSNGKEDIEWLVLAKEGNRALLISKYALDNQPYNRSYTDVTWETCSLREWLNGIFLDAAFSPQEQNGIVSSTVTAYRNPLYTTQPGNNTTDKVFLLGIAEVNRYFGSAAARLCQGTAYCHAQGAYKAANGNCWWWLRSPGYSSHHAAYLHFDGTFNDYGNYVFESSGAVRPALWIDLGY